MISIILPVYNASRTLGRLLDSLLAQRWGDFELVAVDDGSTDDSGEILERYASADSRIRVCRKLNGGANSARNVGLSLCHGDWITFCDADDCVLPDWLESFVDAMSVSPDVIVSGFRYLREDEMDEVHFDWHDTDAASGADEQSVREVFGYLWNKCFRASIIHDHQLTFNESYRFLEDEEFICRFWAYVGRVQFIPAVTYLYYVPDFDTKYARIDAYHLYRSMLHSASAYIHDPGSITMRKYANGSFRCMLLPFGQHDFREGARRLRDFSGYCASFSVYHPFMRWVRRWNYWLILPFLILYFRYKK